MASGFTAALGIGISPVASGLVAGRGAGSPAVPPAAASGRRPFTTRYGHSQLGVIDIADYRRTVDLVHQMVLGLDAARVAKLRAF